MAGFKTPVSIATCRVTYNYVQIKKYYTSGFEEI